jgi:uncharacterized protein
MEFQGKRILITGAAGGLGEVTAVALAEAGATLILSSRNEEKLNEIAAALPNGPHEVVAADLLEPGAAEDVVTRAGEIDILIANAGRPGEFPLATMSADDVSADIRLNLEVPIQMARAVIPQMVGRKSGQIVFVSSLAGKFGLPGSTLYSSTKAGLRGFSWALRAEIASFNVAVSVVSPSFIGEVGMFARRSKDSNRKALPGAGIVSPETYTKTLLAGIEKRKGEITIATPQLKVASQLSVLAPGLWSRLWIKIAAKSAASGS